MDILHTFLVLGFSLIIGLIAYFFFRTISLPTFNRGTRRASTTVVKDSPYNRWGQRLFANLGWQHTSIFERIQTHLRWCDLKENSIHLTEEGLLFQACFYAAFFFLAAIYLNESWAYGMAIMGFYLPFLQLKQKANRIQRQTLHTLPIFTTIIAAEADTGAAPVNAVMRAAQMPIPIGSLIRKELLTLQQQNENIFTYQDVLGLHPGALRKRIQRWNTQDITELISNIDSISKQGVDRSQRLNDLAKTQNLNYQTHVDKAIKSLESRIQIPVGLFFILPLIISVFVPFLIGISL